MATSELTTTGCACGTARSAVRVEQPVQLRCGARGLRRKAASMPGVESNFGTAAAAPAPWTPGAAQLLPPPLPRPLGDDAGELFFMMLA